MIIDAHTHTFPEKIAAKVVEKLQAMAESRAYTKATDAALQESMKTAGIDASVLLPVATNAGQVEKLNDIAMRKNAHFAETGIFSSGAMHPDFENYRAELQRMADGGLTAVKLHPAYQGVDLDDVRFMRIIERAAELDLAIVIHAGLDIGIMHHNFSDVQQICTVIKEIHPSKFVLAHMGGWKGWNDVESTLAGEDVYMDTAFVLGSYEPPEGTFVPAEKTKMMSNGQMKRLVEKHGYDRILFGSDSPWSDQQRTLAQLASCGLDDSKLPLVLGENAARVFQMPICL